MWLILLSTISILLILMVLWYSGLFSTIEVKVQSASTRGTLQIRYKYGQSAYWKCGAIFKELSSLLPSKSLTCGIYYDDPKTTPSSECRWCVGVVTAINGNSLFAENYIQQLHNWGYKTIEIPDTSKAVVAFHPFTWMLSILIAIKRVYPKITTFMESKRLVAYPALEFYHNELAQIEFVMPLENQDKYFVPEAGEHTK